LTPEQELLETIEAIRKKNCPEIPAELVAEIVSIEMDFTDNRSEAYKRIEAVLDKHLKAKATVEA
jgi:hypothetical protein